MNIDFEERDHALIVNPQASRLDAVVAFDFRSSVIARTTGRSTVVIDLSQVGFIDSSGLGCLVSILKSIPAGGQVRLAGINGNIATLLKLTRLDRIFPSFNTVDAAIAG